MGKQNRQRRADKRRHDRRRSAHAGHGHGRARPGADARPRGAWGIGESLPPPPSLDELVTAAVYAVGARPREVVTLVEQLTAWAEHESGAARLSGVLADRLVRALGECWARGWQPADLVHVIGRRLRAPHRQVCADAVALDARSYRHATDADPAWLAQVDAVAQQGGGSAPDRLHLLGSAGGEGDPATVDMRSAIVTVLQTLVGLYDLPAQPRLCTPPSEWGRGPRQGPGDSGPTARRATGSSAPDPKITERVRALLAKAESTDFPDEAEAFTAKAQELIARHAIDLAMLEGAPGDQRQASGRRILIDDPYGKAKALLLGAIAGANRCRTVRHKELGICTVFGAANDLDAVELLYTSLLTQATAAMVTAGRSGAATRSRSFRQSFLVSYADRIGERLREATSSAVDEARARHGDNVLPVLASRDAAADEACERAFPRLVKERISTSNIDGWIAGRAAAERARLGPDTALHGG